MSVAPDIKPETPTGTIESRDEYRRARQRIKELADARDKTPEGLELASLIAAMRDYEASLGGTREAASH